MKIRVTQEHIDKGRQCNEGYCPVALAVLETFGIDENLALGVEKNVYVGEIISIKKNGKILRSKISHSVKRFMSKFDNTGKTNVKPFNFVLELDEPWQDSS